MNSLAKINRAWLYKDLKSLILSNDTKLAQVGECQIGMMGLLGSISTGGDFFMYDFFCFPHVNIANFV